MKIAKGVISAARKAGKIILESFGSELGERIKESHELVTEADLQSQEFLEKVLRKLIPEAGFLGEEGFSGEKPDPPFWLVDPLDGTNNFAHGYPVFCVSIALVDSEGIHLGCIYDPNRDETFFSEKGKGAYLNGNRICVSKTSELESALLATGFPYHRKRGKLGFSIETLVHFLERVQGVRRGGSAALDLAYVACGRLDGFWEQHLKPWDMAAGVLMVEEAGGNAGDYSGGQWSLDSRGIIASNSMLYSKISGDIFKIST